MLLKKFLTKQTWKEKISLQSVCDIKKQNHQFTNLKCCIKAREPFKPPFKLLSFLICHFKKHLNPCFFILKALKDILQHFKLVNWRIRGFVFSMSQTGYTYLISTSLRMTKPRKACSCTSIKWQFLIWITCKFTSPAALKSSFSNFRKWQVALNEKMKNNYGLSINNDACLNKLPCYEPEYSFLDVCNDSNDKKKELQKSFNISW